MSPRTLAADWTVLTQSPPYCPRDDSVQALSKTGFTDRFARWMIAAAGSSFLSQSLVFGYVSAMLVNVLNDLPSTVFW